MRMHLSGSPTNNLSWNSGTGRAFVKCPRGHSPTMQHTNKANKSARRALGPLRAASDFSPWTGVLVVDAFAGRRTFHLWNAPRALDEHKQAASVPPSSLRVQSTNSTSTVLNQEEKKTPTGDLSLRGRIDWVWMLAKISSVCVYLYVHVNVHWWMCGCKIPPAEWNMCAVAGEMTDTWWYKKHDHSDT